MPAIITHDTFGQDIYRELFKYIGDSHDEFQAFLLGNQGPDPLFYSVIIPGLRKHTILAKTMHGTKPNELLFALKRSYSILGDHCSKIGRAYAFGFLCHYVLDSNVHPLVYSQEHELCDAGVANFNRKNNNEVHAVIESELDEMVLFNHYGKTIASFNPAKDILCANDAVLATISKMYVYMAMITYGIFIPENMFTSSLKAMRASMAALHSKTGIKRALIGRTEELFRPYSFYKSMSPRDMELTESIFENRERMPWTNPFTDEECRKSFWDIYDEAQEKIKQAILILDEEDFSVEKAKGITYSLNFSGESTVAVLTIEDASSI